MSINIMTEFIACDKILFASTGILSIQITKFVNDPKIVNDDILYIHLPRCNIDQ